MRYNYSRTDEGAAVIGKSARKLAARRELLQQMNADALCAPQTAARNNTPVL